MAITQSQSTVSPTHAGTGANVYFEDVRAAQEQANHIFGKKPQVHASMCCGAGGDLGTNSPAVNWVRFGGTADGAVENFRFRMRVRPDEVRVTCAAACNFTGTDTGTVRFVVGASGNQDITFALADNGTTKKVNVLTSATGTGWITCVVTLIKTVGAGDAILRRFRVQDQEKTGSFSFPPNE